jgi:hypothetical protein
MSGTDIRKIKFDHIVDSPDYRFVSVTIGGRTRNLRVYSDGRVEL